MKGSSVICLLVCLYFTGLAHGDVHERIEIVNAEIAQSPKDPILLVKRANLYLEDENYEATSADLESAATLSGESFARILMTYAKMYHQLGSNEVAIKYIDQFLLQEPQHVLGIRTKADILLRLNELNASIECRKKVINLTTTLLPENYLSLIETLLLNEDHEAAIAYCQEAIQKMGDLIVFEQKIIDIATTEKNYDLAIAWIDKVMDRYERKEKWLYEKAVLYTEMGNISLAAENLVQAVQYINFLPQRIRMTPAMQQLSADIQMLRLHINSLNNESSTTG